MSPSFRLAEGTTARSSEELEHLRDRVVAAMQEHRAVWGPWAPSDDDSERVRGLWAALYWLDGQEVGPFSDGPATASRLVTEAILARSAARGRHRSRYSPAAAAGIAELLDFARGAVDQIPGFTGGPASSRVA